MENKSKNFKIMENRLFSMHQAMKSVSDDWNNLTPDEQETMCKMYPFDKSFDEVVLETEIWVSAVSNAH